MSYLLFNLAIAVSYITARGTLGYCLWLQQGYSQQLKLARFAMLIAVTAFWLIPPILAWFALDNYSGPLFQPFIRHASDQVLNYYGNLPITSKTIKQTIIQLPDFDTVVIGFLMLITSLNLLYQLANAYQLKSLIKNSYQVKKIGRLTLLSSELLKVPICCSFLKRSYVIIPSELIEQPAHFKWAIAHELQHIRQHDTGWLYVLTTLKITCFINPFIRLWIYWFNELQEFACDEAMMQRKDSAPLAYGQCLLDVAKNSVVNNQLQNVLGLFGFNKVTSQSNLYRRVNMLFKYSKNSSKRFLAIIAGVLLIISSLSTAYALNGDNTANSIAMAQLQNLVKNTNKNSSIHIEATPELLTQINIIRNDPKAKEFMRLALKRMDKYKPMIEAQLQKHNIPNDLLALPLMESAYKNLAASENIMQAAGIWQIIPVTAQRYGLIINETRDDRLNPSLETKAAANYLQNLYAQFNDWNLTMIAYEIGELKTKQLMQQVGSRNSWDMMRSHYASEDLRKYLPALNAAMVIMHNPSLFN